MTKQNDMHPLYKKYKPVAKLWKVRLQMLVGAAIPLLLFVRLMLYFSSSPGEIFVLGVLADQHPLHIVSYALAISAGIELAYMLFTPGPDEAVEPLILGLAAAVLLLVSEKDLADFELAWSVLVFTACIGFLFWIRSRFAVLHDGGDDQQLAQDDDPASGGTAA